MRPPEDWHDAVKDLETILVLVMDRDSREHDIRRIFDFNGVHYVDNDDPLNFEWRVPDPYRWRWFAILSYLRKAQRPKRKPQHAGRLAKQKPNPR